MSEISSAHGPTISRQLEDWIVQGGRRIGEIAIEPLATDSGSARFRLCHHADAGRHVEADAEILTDPKQARDIVRYNEAGEYRPLKTAPDLRNGWVMELRDIEALREALDYFYPAMIGTWFGFRAGKVSPTHLRETLNRQTGMYRFARTITDADAQALIARTCNSQSACLKRLLWQIDDATPVTSLPAGDLSVPSETEAATAIPLLCAEACNLVIAGARIVARKAAEAGAKAG